MKDYIFCGNGNVAIHHNIVRVKVNASKDAHASAWNRRGCKVQSAVSFRMSVFFFCIIYKEHVTSGR
jgi:hypothetical protein